ncbi:helix-turn-helix domain-containing protein [Micromonospora aurantiaca (nom. illeg.)]|uniref:helix-turn-helix domain-containing protein n=1 Tax=Micromonospora aurantiaca (nom. illeg.) TaxID=47850 RepID=UPI001656AAC0|nr:helix-turn-helix transcriptional regulator [Micromonospora aurantiaca]MBC9004120.1 helix-turn-helix transcriptional regulator [Micromonospora aurantiaca]
MSDDEHAEYEGPLLVTAGTPGNRRFGALLKSMRERSGLSPQELADRADVHVSFVRGIERGAQAPSVATARSLLACLGEQHRIQWRDSGTYDLLIYDSETEREVAFDFKAKMKGQNRRTDVDREAAFEAAAVEAIGRWSPSDRAAFLDAISPSLKAVALMTTTFSANAGEMLRRVALTQVAETGEPRTDAGAHDGDEQPGSFASADDTSFGRVVRLLASADDELLGRVESMLRDELGHPGT